MHEGAELGLPEWIAIAVGAHVALIAFSRRMHPLFLLAGSFLVLAPLSLATDLESAGAIKYVRLYVTVLMVVVGIVGYQLRFSRGASGALLVFVVFYAMASLWSSRPHMALFYKGMFALTVLSGILLAQCSRTVTDLLRGLRWLGVVAGLAGIVAFVQYARDPEGASRVGRMAVWGLNANALAMTAAGLFLLCMYLACYESSPKWKAFAIVVCALLGVEILATGSRGGLLMAVSGGGIIALPYAKHPKRFAAIVLVFAAVSYGVLSLVELQRLDRFTDFTSNTREGVWKNAWRQFGKSPVIGQGWIASGRGSTANVMNIYLQTLVETGLVGAGLFAGCLIVIAKRAKSMYLSLRNPLNPARTLGFLAIGLTAAVLLHGTAESAAFLGSTLNALLFGFGVGLIDRLPELALCQNMTMRSSESSMKTRQCCVGVPSQPVPRT